MTNLLPPFFRRRLPGLGLLGGLIGLPTLLSAQTPVLLSTTPARQALAAPTATSVSLTFSTPMAPATSHQVRVFSAVQGGRRVPTTATVSGGSVALTFGTPFRPGETVQVVATTGMTSTAGVPVAAGQVYQFTTATPAVTPAFTDRFDVSAPLALNAMVPADVDNDGDLDLLSVVNSVPSSISVQLNQGGNTFSSPTLVPVTNSPLDLAAADIDSDGDLDLLSVGPGSYGAAGTSRVSVCFNDGAGNFTPTAVVAVGTHCRGLSLADLDADGDLDLLTANSTDGTVSVRFNDGLGNFSGTTDLPTGSGANRVVLGDVDNDGDLDLLCPNPLDNTISLRLNNGAGSFSGGTDLAVGAGCYEVALADIDGDHDLDLLTPRYLLSRVDVFLNNGAGGFAFSTSAAVGARPSDLKMSDLDGDGDLDLLTSNYAGHSVSIRYNTDGTFGGGSDQAVDQAPGRLAVADVTGDGAPDALTCSITQGSITIRPNQAAAPPPPPPVPFTLTALSPGCNASNVARTGTPTIVATYSQTPDLAAPHAIRIHSDRVHERGGWSNSVIGNQHYYWLPTYAPGEQVEMTLTTAITTPGGAALPRAHVSRYRVATGAGPGNFEVAATPRIGTGATSAQLADINADGFPDLLATAQDSNVVTIRLNDGTGRFGVPSFVNAPSPLSIAILDIDDDLDLDFVTINDGTAGQLHVFRNDGRGSGSFSAAGSVLTGSQPSTVRWGDLDGDGDLDLLIGERAANTVGFYRNDGTGVFTRQAPLPMGASPLALAITDLNCDGDLDLVVGLANSAVSVWSNNGTGTFGPTATVALTGRADHLVMGDLDNDGDEDLIVHEFRAVLDNVVGIFINDGSGAFSRLGNLGERVYVDALAVGDVKGDGRLAIMLTQAGHEVATYYNLGGLRFVVDSLGHPLTRSYNLDLALADLDRDGDLDAVTPNLYDHSVSVLLNRVHDPADDFYLVSGTPQPNVSNVASSAAINLTFNEPPRASLPAPVTASSGGQANPVGGSSSAGNNWSVGNRDEWFPGARVDYTIAGARSARTGRLLRRPYVRQFWVAAGQGQGTLTPAPDLSIQAPTYSLLTDINRDHQLDLVIASTVTNNVRISLGTGTGTFGTPTTLVSGGLPMCVQAADLNHDGFQDLLVANNATNDVSVRLGSPTGTFTSVASVSVNGNAQYLIVADFDADTHPDLAVANPSASTISVRFGTGTGTFGRAQNLALGQQPNRLVAFDVEGDGDLDLLSANYTPTLSLLRNDGTGHFSAPALQTLSETPNDLVVADFNQDGYPDVFTASAANPMLYVERLMGSAAGTLVPASRLAYNGSFTANAQLAAADLTGDGYPDLLLNNFNFLQLLVVPNTRAGFGTPQTISLPGSAYGITTGDINNDLAVDVALPLVATNQVRILLNTAPDLVVNTVANIPGGTYRNLTVTGTGRGTLAGNVRITGTLTVQTGGELGGTDGSTCYRITGPGNFVVAPGSTFYICDTEGISTSGTTGMVQVTGSRTYASEASYAFNGPSFQRTGNGLPATIDNLIQANVFGLSLTQPVAVRRAVRFAASGHLTDGNRLTLLSNATSSAMLINAGPGRVVGAATVQRWISPALNRGLGYRHLSSPVTATTVADLACAGFAPYVNAAYNTLPRPTLPLRQFPLIFGYDERRAPVSSDFYDGYFSPLSVADPLVVGRGYAVLISGNLTPDFVGTLTQEDVTISGLTRTGNFMASNQKSGWHLLGNPFPSPLDWDQVPVPAGLSAAISVWRSTGPNTGYYQTRAGGLGSLPDGLLPLGQAFFARVTGTGPVDLTLPTSARPTTYANPIFARPAPDTRPVLSLRLRAAGAQATEADETFVYLTPAATPGADDAFDGLRPGPNVGFPTLGTLINGEVAAVNALPAALPPGGLTVELTATAPTASQWELAPDRLDNLTGYDVVLLDRLTHTRYPLAAGLTVRFATTRPDEEVRGRFALVFGPTNAVTGVSSTSLTPLSSLTLWPNPSHGGAQVRIPTDATHLEVLDLTGRVVLTQPVTPGTVQALPADLPRGVYVVRAGGNSIRWVVE